MPLIDNSELVLDRERERLIQAQARHSAGLADQTFSGLQDDKDPETAFRLDSETLGAPGLASETWETTKPDPAHLPLKGTGFSPYIEPAKEKGALAPEAKPPRPDPDSHDTVGAVALDARGNLAAATSTGGTLNKTPGRVGDSSLIGCGCYADNLAAAVSLTGWGETIMKLVLGKWATDRVSAGSAPEIAAREAISYLYNRLGGHGGIILLGPDGRFGLAHNTPAMAWGIATPGGLQTGLTI
jgi:beta-aspartyl-peptidase (threonine type)